VRGPRTMTHRAARALSAIAAVWLAVAGRRASPLAASSQELTPLDQGAAVERRVDRGESHGYAITPKAGECAQIVVEQRGMAVIVEVRGADGAPAAEFEDEIRTVGEEHVDVVASADSTYSVLVRAAPWSAAPGAYAIRLAGRRPATDFDRALYEARVTR